MGELHPSVARSILYHSMFKQYRSFSSTPFLPSSIGADEKFGSDGEPLSSDWQRDRMAFKETERGSPRYDRTPWQRIHHRGRCERGRLGCQGDRDCTLICVG